MKKKQDEILKFLELKEVKQLEADLRTLTEIQSDYRYNWNDERFIRVNLNQTQNIGSNAKGKIALYQKQIVDRMPKKFFLVLNKGLVDEALLGIGDQIDKMGSKGINEVLTQFRTCERTNVEPFVSCIVEVDRLHNKPMSILIAGDKLYIEQK